MPSFFVNPFKKHDVSEFEGVYKPFAESQRHHTIVDVPRDEKSSIRKEKSDGGKDQDLATADSKDLESPPPYSANTIEGLRTEIDTDIAASGHDSIYDRKSKLINLAIQDIGMGRYQWELFALCGFGWVADNLWLQGIALTLPQLSLEFGVSDTNVRYTTCALFIGLCLGASIWGVLSDVIGRRIAFNATLLIAGVFGIAAGAAPNWIGVCGLFAAIGTGIGGNLPVDGALFLEFLPMASGKLLTLLSVWWPVGQLIGSLIAWAFIPQFSCPPAEEGPCTKEQNMGWRYHIYTLGAITFSMFISRFFLFHLYESPKFLLSRGRQAEAIATIHGIAYKNKRTTWLNEEIMNEVGGLSDNTEKEGLATTDIVKRTLGKFSTDRIAPLFATRELGLQTGLMWFCWATIGMGYPLFNAFLPQYLANAGKDLPPTPTNIVYRNYAITSIVGVPGSILGCYMVDIKYIGRKGTIASATLITGILLFVFTVSNDPNFQTAMSSLEAFFQNIMYGVLFAYTPEVFPAPNRGTGTGIASFFNRLCGLCAPLVAIHAGGADPNAPVYASGALILAAFLAMCFFPIETRGKQSL